MRQITEREKRTLRYGAIGITLYLILFSWGHFKESRAEYAQVLKEVESLQQEVRLYEDKAAALKQRMVDFRMDPGKLSSSSLVAETSAALQKAALARGIQVGPVREFPGRSTARELASLRIEGVGPVGAIFTFLHQLESIGSPVVVESVQMDPNPAQPGTLKFNLNFIILDFEQWKKQGGRNA